MTTLTIDEPLAWSVTIGGFLMNLLIMGFLKSYTILMTEFQYYLNCSSSTVMVAGGLLTSLIALPSPIVNLLCTKITTRYTIIIGAILTSLSFICLSLVRSSAMYIFMLFCIGFSFSLCYSSTLCMIPRVHQRHRMLSTGITMCGSSMGLVLVPFLISSLLHFYALSGCILVLAGIFLHLIIVGVCMPSTILHARSATVFYQEGSGKKNNNDKLNKSKSSLDDNVFGSTISLIFGRFGIFIVATCLSNIGFTAQYSMFASVSKNLFAVSSQQITICLAVQGCVDALTRVIFGLLGDRWNIKKNRRWIYLSVSLVFMTFGGILLTLPIARWSEGEKLVLWIVYSLIFCISGGIYITCVFVVACQLSSVEKFGKAYSILLMFFGCTNTPGHYILGTLHDLTGNYVWSMLCCSIFTFVSAILIAAIHFYRRPPDGEVEVPAQSRDEIIQLEKFKT